MARKPNQLSLMEVNRLIKNTAKPCMFGDGLGLYLMVRRPGDGAWCFRYKVAGKTKLLGLGPCHTVSLPEARLRAREARQLILDGKDPIAVRREASAAALKVLTFKQAAEQFLETERVAQFKSEVHRKQWRSTLETYAFPVIGDLPLQSIDFAVVLQTLLPVWKRVPETGSRLRGRIERVFEWARPLGLFEGPNPASREILKDHLPVKAKAKHHAALPYADVSRFCETLRQRDSVSARALEFTILTAVRTSEAIGATWSEIDMDAATWTIPAARMKAKRDHRVPLSDRAVEILRSMDSYERRKVTGPALIARFEKQWNREHPDHPVDDKTGHYRCGLPDHLGEQYDRGLLDEMGKGHVFINGGGKPLSNMAMSELLKGMMPPERATVHGFRSTFSDWARDQTSYPRDVIEMALAHTIKDKSEAAYRRGDAIDKRRKLMDAWSRYCEAPMVTGATIHKIGKAV